MLLNSLAIILSVTLSLQQCKDMAKTNNPDMKNAALNVESAKALKGEALSAYFPVVKASALSFRSLNPLIDIGVTDILGTSDAAWNLSNYVTEYAQENGLHDRYRALQFGYGAVVSAVQPIYAGGRIVNGNALASLGVRAAVLQQEMQQRTTDSSIEEKYWRVVSLQEKRDMLEKATSTLDAAIKDADQAMSAGVITANEYSEVEQRKNELHVNEIKLKGGLALAKMDLFNAIGMEYSASQLDSIVLSGSLADLPSPESVYVPEEQMCSRMQEMELLNLRVEANRYQKKMMVGETLPQVGLGLTYGYGKYLNDPSANGMAFVTVQVPISDWGKTAQKMKRYENEVQKAANERDYYQAQLLLKARGLWIKLGMDWEELELARSNAAKEEADYKVAQDRFNAGTATMTELLLAELDMRKAADALSDAQIAYRKSLDEYLDY